MKRKLVLVGALALGLIVGGVIGASGKTRTITRTTTVAETTTVVRAKSVVPAACRSAISQARAFALEAGEAFRIAATFPPLVAEAAAAGAAQDVGQITSIASRLRSGATRLGKLAPTFNAAATAFNRGAADCR